MELALDGLFVRARSRDEGLFEFSCPSCGRLNIRPLDGVDLEALDGVGIFPQPAPAPFELLEPHHGPPITWDDLIDFHQAVARLDGRRSRDHQDVRPGDRPVHERDAA